jgi:hypothetical protein
MANMKLLSAVKVVAFIAVSLGTIRAASAPIAVVAMCGTYTILFIASIGAATCSRGRRGRWKGFAIAGLAYFSAAFLFDSSILAKQLPTTHLITLYAASAIPLPASVDGFQLHTEEYAWPKITYLSVRGVEPSAALRTLIVAYNKRIDNSITIGHCSLTIAVALLGSLLGRCFESHAGVTFIRESCRTDR